MQDRQSPIRPAERLSLPQGLIVFAGLALSAVACRALLPYDFGADNEKAHPYQKAS